MKTISLKQSRIIYWTSTGLFGAFMLSTAIPNILQTQEWVNIFNLLDYPQYMLPFIGVAKLLGITTLLIPGFPRLKEWAYAGLFFDLVGAVYTGLYVGGFHPQMLTMLVPFALGTVSYLSHHRINSLKQNNS